MFERDPGLFFPSTHQMPLYPGTGAAEETGVAGNVVNAPLRPHSDGEAFRRAMERLVLPALDAFAPELVLVSAGFDAHRRDPLAALDLEDEDYASPFDSLADWHLMRALAIHRPDLARPYVHLVDQEPFDED